MSAQNSNQGQSGAGRRNAGNGKVALGMCAAVVFLVILFIIGYIPKAKRNHANEARADEVAHSAPAVVVVKPVPSPDVSLTLPGNTQAIIDAQVGARTTGYISKRYVDIGDHVRAGQVLAEIQSPDVDQQLYQANMQQLQAKQTVLQSQNDVANRQATVTQARSTVAQYEANLESTKAALADSEAKLNELKSAEKTAEAQLEQALQTVKMKEAALKQANTSMELAKVTYERYVTLLKSGYETLQDVDTNKAAYENAIAAVNSAESDLRGAQKAADAQQAVVDSAKSNIVSGEAEVKAAEKNVNAAAATVRAGESAVRAALANVRSGERTVDANKFAQQANEYNTKHYKVLTSFEKVVAPFDGVITARNVDVGSLVNTGAGAATGGNTPSAFTGSTSTAPQPGLFSMARTDVLRIFIPVPQSYAPYIHQHQTTHITIREFPGQVFQGEVAKVSGALDTSSRTLLTEVHIPNPDGKLYPGMFAQVTFDLPKTGNGLVVPATAVIYDAKGTRVVTMDAEQKIHHVPVVMGRDYNTSIELVQGITPSDTIVASPSDDLVDGEKIKPIVQATTNPAGPPAANGFPIKQSGKPRTPRGGNATEPQ